jgi:crotonobetainyl-CoA:carnitine CoA-transferase CaiB-like acyl-CoA transferase
VPEPGIGDLRLFTLTARFEKTPASIDAPPPRLSAHTDAILSGLGYTPEAITALRQKGAV